MQYEAPYGVADPNQSYFNGDIAVGQEGSIPPAAAFENHQREIINFILKTGLTPADTDLYQLTKSTRAQRVVYVADSGAANSLSGAMDPILDAYILGQPFYVRVLHDNTGPATFDCGPGRFAIVRSTGDALIAGDLRAGMVVALVWDGARFQMVNFGTGAGLPPDLSTGPITYFNVKLPYVADIGTANHVVAPFSPAITTVTEGDVILVKIANRTTGATNIQVNALTVQPIKTIQGNDLGDGSFVVDQIAMLVWAGSFWQALNACSRKHEVVYNTFGSYTWTVPAGCYDVEVELWGSGSAGFNSTVGPLASTPGGTDGPGGQAGGYARKSFSVVPGTNYSLTVGKGGGTGVVIGGWPGRGQAGYGDVAGAVTSFDTVFSATGGAAWTTPPTFPLGGIGTGGDENIRGGTGHVMTINTTILGYNGAYAWGGGAPRGGGVVEAYRNGAWPGGGGGGGDFYGPVGSAPSGAGADGGIIIRWWS
jgi:hypothetical protein